MLAANNMQLEQIKLVDIGFGVQPLLVKHFDAIMGFSMNEPIEAESGGMAVSLMPISDYGVNTYGLTIVSNPDFMQQKPKNFFFFRLALAERLRRKTDRIDPTRVCRPYCRPGRTINLTVRRLLVAQKADVRVPLRRHWTRAKVQYALAVLCLRDPSFICSSFWLPHLRRAQQQLPISR